MGEKHINRKYLKKNMKETIKNFINQVLKPVISLAIVFFAICILFSKGIPTGYIVLESGARLNFFTAYTFIVMLVALSVWYFKDL